MSLANPFTPAKNRERGARARGYGELFENMVRASCAKTRIELVKIPDGCRTVWSSRSRIPILKRVKTPFDFMLLAQGMTACVDAKTVDSGNFSYSMIELHQVHSLIKIHDQNVSAGFLVWFRDVNDVVFFTAKQLYHLKARESLKPQDGISVGTGQNFNLNLILGTIKG